MPKTILILAANPINTDRLRLDEEVRLIDEGLRRSKQRDNLTLQQRWAVRSIDIHRALLDYEPNIVHFAGHGTGEDGIVLQNDQGESHLASSEALADLFQLFSDVECVVLNACYSESQADAISKYINHVIGMSKNITDNAAMKFAMGFYDAIGAGKPAEFAYKLGCSAIGLAGIPENLTPILKSKDLSQQREPDHRTVRLKDNNELKIQVLREFTDLHGKFMSLRYQYNSFFIYWKNSSRSAELHPLNDEQKNTERWRYFQESCALLGEFHGMKPLLISAFPKAKQDIEFLYEKYQDWRRRTNGNRPILQYANGRNEEAYNEVQDAYIRTIKHMRRNIW